LHVCVPSVSEQLAIADVLESLDDKIEQNRRTGRALEGLARATFKAWFMNFESVKAKGTGAAGFPGMPAAAFAALPDRMTNSPIGPVPQGWEVSNIGTVAQRIAMGPFGSDIKTDNFVSDGVPVIRGGISRTVLWIATLSSSRKRRLTSSPALTLSPVISLSLIEVRLGRLA